MSQPVGVLFLPPPLLHYHTLIIVLTFNCGTSLIAHHRLGPQVCLVLDKDLFYLDKWPDKGSVIEMKY